MKRLPFILFVLLLCACARRKSTSSEEISVNLGKLRAFGFVNSDSVAFYRNKLQKLCDPDVPAQKARLKYADAIFHLTAGIHSRALLDFKEAVRGFEKEKTDSFVAICLLGQANCYKIIGKSDDAIFNYLKALEIFEQNNNKKYINACNANLAETYEEKNDTSNAAIHLLRAKAGEEYGSKTYISILHLQANLLGMTGKTDSALLTDNEGIALAQQNNYPELLSSFFDNTARCFTDQKKYDSAIFYYRKCILADSLNGRIQLMADTYAQLVNIYAVEHNEKLMNEVTAHALRLCDSTQYLRGKHEVYEALDYYYSGEKKWEKAAQLKDSLQNIYRRLVNEETESKIAGYNVEYETSKKEQLITKQKNDLQKITYISVLLGLVALLLVISIIAVYKNYKGRKDLAVSRAIQDQKDINLQSVFESEQHERIRIARDLHDSIGQKLSVMKMYLTGEVSNFAKTPALLDETITEVRNISHNLLPEELNFGLLKAINSDIEKIKSSGKFTVNVHTAEGDYEKIPLASSLNIIMIFRELLSNLVNHSDASNLQVALSAQVNIFTMRLTDNGKGISREMIEESKGIGWKNIFARMNMLKADIDITDNVPNGNIVTIKIPFA